MWDTPRLSSVGNFSLRRIALLFVAVMMSATFLVTAFSPTSYAVDVDAKWSGETLNYDGNGYTAQDLTLPGTESGSKTYVFTPASETCPKPSKVIVIPSGADTTKIISNAKEVDYMIDCNNNYTNPATAKTISVDAKFDGVANSNGNGQNQTACAVEGVGWIICSTSRFMASSMDRIYGWISSFLTVKPLSTDTSSPLFQVWAIVRGLANACFIVAFLIIIYSQMTQMGISNYEIKKMIPRLIIAAILVNVSYYICAAAVDVSNIMGDSIAKALSEIRDSLPAPLPQGDFFSKGGVWSIVTAFILSAGAAGGAGMLALSGGAAGGGVAALTTLMFPVLIMAILSVLVALLVLAARQALITVLVAVSPLAFVLYLLPNTEKYFEKWRGMFTTMLLVFPMFSLLFGGSQLASYIIIQNTDRLEVVILALFVQAAPLALTPFLVRFSGSLLGRLAGMVNNPQKGLVDRSRNWAKDRADTLAKRNMARGENKPAWKPTGLAYRRQAGKRKWNDRKKMYESRLDAAWANDERSHRITGQTKAAEQRKSMGDAVAERKYEQFKERTPSLQNYSGVQWVEQSRVKQMHAAEEAQKEEAMTNRLPQNSTNPYAQFSQEANNIYKEQKFADSNAALARAVQSSDYAKALSTDVTMQIKAGGSVDKLGGMKVQASALSEMIEASAKNVQAIKTSSPVKAGDVSGLRVEFENAVANNDLDSLRAYADMLGESKDFGIRALRELLNTHHDTIKNSDMHETFMHALSNSRAINESAEDIGRYARDVNPDDPSKSYRKLSEISADADTWRKMTSIQFATNKASSQREALMAKDDKGNWAISRKAALDIRQSQAAWDNIKDDMKPLVLARIQGVLNKTIKGEPTIQSERDDTSDPSAQHIPDEMIPPNL
jgi:hypothetical protein